MDIVLSPEEGSEVCDFCTSNEPIYQNFPAKDFNWVQVKGVDLNSRGHWAACQTCAEMIKKDDWDGLLNRAIKSFVKNHPDLAKFQSRAKEAIRELHQKFRDNRLREDS